MFQEMQAILINSQPQDTGPIRCKGLLKHKPALEVFIALNLETVIIWIMATCICGYQYVERTHSLYCQGRNKFRLHVGRFKYTNHIWYGGQ
jgi:hypothetical protein